MTTTATRTPAQRRAARHDNYKLAEEIARHAAVSARHRSRSEMGTGREVGDWAYSADRAEEHFCAEVDEARTRLETGRPNYVADLQSWLAFFGSAELVEVKA